MTPDRCTLGTLATNLRGPTLYMRQLLDFFSITTPAGRGSRDPRYGAELMPVEFNIAGILAESR